MGQKSVKSSRDLFKKSDLPAYGTPEAAVRAFAALSAYHENQQHLLQVPGPLTQQTAPAIDNAKMYSALKNRYENLVDDFQLWFDHTQIRPQRGAPEPSG